MWISKLSGEKGIPEPDGRPSVGEGCGVNVFRVVGVRWFGGGALRDCEVDNGLLSADSKARTGYCMLYEFLEILGREPELSCGGIPGLGDSALGLISGGASPPR